MYNAHESNDYEMDFAILELKNELEFSEKIQKIKLPDKNFDLTENYTARVTGYGRTGATEELSEYLKRAELSIIMSDKCIQISRISNRICARDLHQKASSIKINIVRFYFSFQNY